MILDALVGIQLVDHFIVGGDQLLSFKEKGLM
ncbi:JAB domain-containing protein [Motiliproteus sp. MSK22-1]